MVLAVVEAVACKVVRVFTIHSLFGVEQDVYYQPYVAPSSKQPRMTFSAVNLLGLSGMVHRWV